MAYIHLPLPLLLVYMDEQKYISPNELGRNTTHPRNEAKHLVGSKANETLGILKKCFLWNSSKI